MKLQKKMIISLILIIAVALSLSIIVWVIITPPHRVSKPDVTDRGETYSGFFPTAVTPGFTDFDVWCDIENLGGSSSGVFNVTYYASTDTIISTEDYLIGMDTVSSISSLEYGDSMWSGVFPSSGIPYGVYFIGWIIDSEDNVNEFDETNNIFYISSYQLIVECTPGAPIDTPEDRIIKIGILADFTHITGEGTFQGSYLAIKGINEAGGILIHNSADPTFPNGTYYLGIVGENTYEAEPYLDITKGALAANKLITQHDPDFFIGGYRTEAVMTYREYIMDEHKIFMNTGASTDSFCVSVATNYDRYKYCFRGMPTNTSSLAKELVEFYALALKPAMEAELGITVDKVAIIREDLEWTIPMSYMLQGYYAPYGYYGLNNNPLFNFTIVYELAYPMTATAADFTVYINQLQASGAQIVVPLISYQGGIKLMTQYDSLQPDFMVAGIDYMSELGDYWYDTAGGCAYEIIMQSTTRTNKTTITIPMWDAYVDMWDMDPFYTAIGSYDSVFMLVDAINKVQSIYSDYIVAQLETIDKTNPFEGASGNIAFNSYHDLIEGYDPISKQIYSTYLWKQWQSGGTQAVVTSAGFVYPEWIVDAPIQIPPWM